MKVYIKIEDMKEDMKEDVKEDVIEYNVKVRGQRCKKETYKSRIEMFVLDHLGLNTDTHFVRLLTGEDEKELEDVYVKGYITRKSEYYFEGETLKAFVQTFEEQRNIFFQKCEVLLSKARQLYHSLREEENEEENINYIKKDIKEELETAMWQMSHSLGSPVIINGCDPQVNTVKKLSKDPVRTILYYTRSINSCENLIQKYLKVK